MINHESSNNPHKQSKFDEKFDAIIDQNNLEYLDELAQAEELKQQRISLKGYYALQAELGYPNEEVEEDEED